MSEPLVLLEDDEDEGPRRATTAVVRTHIKAAAEQLRHIVSTGNDEADNALADAEMMLRKAMRAIRDQT